MPHDIQQRREARLGVLCGVGAYVVWGITALYWKGVQELNLFEVLAHRAIWACVIVGLVLLYQRRFMIALRMVADLRMAGLLILTGLLLAANWSIFIWAVLSDQVLQASLGYYINPLVNVVLGFFLLKERMSGLQWTAVGFAAAGVLGMLVVGGTLPWAALILAVTFAVYGYLRKVSGVVAMDALFIETAIFVPPALGVLLWLGGQGALGFGAGNLSASGFLIMGGLVTFIPLALFGEAVRRIRLVTIGFLQYLSPTIQFFLAVYLFGEPFGLAQIVAFGCIWIGLALYSADAMRTEVKTRAGRQGV